MSGDPLFGDVLTAISVTEVVSARLVDVEHFEHPAQRRHSAIGDEIAPPKAASMLPWKFRIHG